MSLTHFWESNVRLSNNKDMTLQTKQLEGQRG